MKTVEIYSKDNCPFCDKAVRLAQQFQFGECGLQEFTVKKLDVDFNMDDMMHIFPTARTFPQIIVDGEKIGGYTEFEPFFTKPQNNT
jgi:glutaredoxin 3